MVRLPTFAPIADWTKTLCFDYVEAHSEQFNPLYRLGFDRVGCAPCINSSNADILNWSILRPETIEKVRGLEEWTGRTFFYPVRRDSVPNRIDEVVGWARTSRGGKQEPFPIFDERAACESKYGLCE
jgi:3'-phosphoadenosine 5'-phosphosulfate sulfotransferase (PAPS reductase)/FAD synthetase